MKKALLISAICLLLLFLTGMSHATDAQSSKGQVLYSYEGNITEKDIVPVDLLSLFGVPAHFIAETVKFKAPKADWKINAVQLYGWDGYNGSEESIPRERIISVEIRDKDLNLLYKFADSQLPYTNYARNATLMYPFTISIPQISVSDDFYVCFYDRGAIAIGSEILDEISQNSFIYIEGGDQLLPAALPTGENTSIPINWIMKISGS